MHGYGTPVVQLSFDDEEVAHLGGFWLAGIHSGAVYNLPTDSGFSIRGVIVHIVSS